MSKKQLEVMDMQCWVFRMAQIKWNMSLRDCAKLLQKYDILGVISECYELHKVSIYKCALAEVVDILRTNGVNIFTS